MIDPVVISFVALFVAAIGPGLTALASLLANRRIEREARLIWRRDYLRHIMEILIELRAELQFLQDKGRETVLENMNVPGEVLLGMEEKREIAYGKAFGYMLTIPDKNIRGQAGRVMNVSLNPTENEKLTAIGQAIIALGDLLDKSMGTDEGVSSLAHGRR